MQQTQPPLPNNLTVTEYRELVEGSCIHPDLISLNFFHLEGDRPLNCLFISDQLPRRNTGMISHRYLHKYRHVTEGGWWCHGVDVLNNFQDELWGQFKPLKPRLNPERNKIIKYEAPPLYPTSIFALKVSSGICSKISQHYPSSLIPHPPSLTFWQWVIENPSIPVMITEGAKKAAALLSAGYVAIALPGIFNGYRQPKDALGHKIGLPRLIPQLEVFAREERIFYFAFDQDPKPQTVRNVNQAIVTTGQLLEQKGCTVKVMAWSDQTKGVDDLIRERGLDAFKGAYNDAISLQVFQVKNAVQLTYKAKIRVNQRYLFSDQLTVTSDQLSVNSYQLPVTSVRTMDDENSPSTLPTPHFPLPTSHSPLPTPHSPLPIPTTAKLIAIKSPKNTGKTYFLEQVVAQAIHEGKWVLVLGHRVKLVEALCHRFGIPYATEIQDSETGTVLGYGLCVDSLHPRSSVHFNAENWSDGIIIIDEAEQVFWHLLNASTCMNERVSILKSFKTLIQNTLNGEGRVYLADADLSDLAIDYVKSLVDFYVEPFVIVNDWKPSEDERWLVNLYEEKNPARLVKDLIEHIEQGGKPFVFCSAQKVTSKWGTQNLSAFLSRKFPEKKILVLDSETLKDRTHPAYDSISFLNDFLRDYDVILCSPVVETGISIECEGITSVWGIAQGVQPAETVRQALARVRANVPRYLWVAQRGFQGSMIGNGATSVKSLLASTQKVAKANLLLLMSSDYDSFDYNYQAQSLTTWAKRACAINLGFRYYRETIIQGLREEGHLVVKMNILDRQPDDLKDINDINGTETIESEIKQVCQENYRAKCTEIAQMENPDDVLYQHLKEKIDKSSAELKQERKGDLTRRYGLEVTPELVEKDDQGWYGQLLYHYYLTMGQVFLKPRDLSILSNLVGMNDSNQNDHSWLNNSFNNQPNNGHKFNLTEPVDLWLPDLNQKLLISQIKMLASLGIKQLLIEGKQWRGSDPELINLATLAKANQWQIKACLNLTIKENDSPIAIAQKLLSKLGIKLHYIGRLGSREHRERVYTYLPPADQRQEVFIAWMQRDEGLFGRIDRESNLEQIYQTTEKENNYSSAVNHQGRTDLEKTKSVSTPSNNINSIPIVDIKEYGH